MVPGMPPGSAAAGEVGPGEGEAGSKEKAMNLQAWPQRVYKFVCLICGQPGIGPLGTKTHPGECRLEANRRRRREWTAERTRERAERRRV